MANPSSAKLPETDPKERLCRKFQSEATAIQEQIAQLPTFAAVGGERQDALEHILAAISRLSSEVADAVDVLPPYDLRTYTQVVGALSEQVNETIAKLAPKARFKFKSRSLSGGAGTTTVKNQALRPLPLGTSLNAEAGEASGHDRSSSGLITSQPTKGSNERPAEFPTHTIHVAGKCGEHLMLSAPTVRGVSAGSVKDVKRCVVDLRAATDGSDGFASLALKNVTDSLIVAGDVRGPVHVTGLRNSVVVVVAKQVRLHECNEVDIYLHCGSHPIIEDCKTMRFAPAPATFLTEIGDASVNQWDQVDDFKWLKAGKSPNWTVLPEGERISGEAWKRIMSDKSINEVENTLVVAGIRTPEAVEKVQVHNVSG